MTFTQFCREFLGANIFGPFLYLCYFDRFFHLWVAMMIIIAIITIIIEKHFNELRKSCKASGKNNILALLTII